MKKIYDILVFICTGKFLNLSWLGKKDSNQCGLVWNRTTSEPITCWLFSVLIEDNYKNFAFICFYLSPWTTVVYIFIKTGIYWTKFVIRMGEVKLDSKSIDKYIFFFFQMWSCRQGENSILWSKKEGIPILNYSLFGLWRNILNIKTREQAYETGRFVFILDVGVRQGYLDYHHYEWKSSSKDNPWVILRRVNMGK